MRSTRRSIGAEDPGGFMLLALESAAMTVQLRDRDVIDLGRLRA